MGIREAMKYKINQEVVVSSIKDTIFTPALVGTRVKIEALREDSGAYLVSIPGHPGMQFPIPETHLSDVTRTLSMIARNIQRSWKPVHPWAAPYVDAMLSLRSIDDSYGLDSAREIVARFLGNAAMWKGPEARSIKAELRAML
jgi:hypothetical protein